MSQTDAGELLAAVNAFLRSDVLPQLHGFAAYNTRVAANSLAIVERELRLTGDLNNIDQQAVTSLRLDAGSGSVQRQLATRLRSGNMTVDSTLLAYLKQRTLKAMEIDNPQYSGYLQACERWSAETTEHREE